MPERLSLARSLADLAATADLGKRLGQALKAGDRILLHGPLGAGKTALAAAILAGCGHTGGAKSPTYTLVEEYPLTGLRVVHADLYRLKDGAELEAIGWRDYDDGRTAFLVEWPERAGLASGDIDVSLRLTDHGREARLRSLSPRGDEILKSLDR
ncbi:MAG: tRNA (adenosine(37)-N6)-threonylcarbamoyltransferase complex ATPase subunit type 1 TsaE [Gammaproteobacteria bacterium]|nr:tRNA (adenosine(37)-N6)-threonylcarbamoyltransferase complex ATPase subunit type 1 TsaE [Gammaproteobacteria bacterium]